MKDLTRAAELLAELRALTDNDFERHRIDVLERDLTSPPVPEQIDETHQRFDGVTYCKNKSGHFKTGRGIHQSIWCYYHGDIPEGHVIHHDNENPADNSVANLVLKTNSEHSRIHSKERVARRTKELRCASCGKIFIGYHAYHANHYCPECRENPYHKTCPVCGKTFNTNNQNACCCSQACAGQIKHEQGSETRQCPICSGYFEVKKHSQKKYCSINCRSKARSKQGNETRQCPICGKTFEVNKCSKKKCCSLSCGNKYRWQNRKTGD